MRTYVMKRDGSKEVFDPAKITRVVTAAGLNSSEAAKLTKSVGDWIRKQNKQLISSLKIRDKVLQELKLVDEYAAGLFEWYQSTKENQPLSSSK